MPEHEGRAVAENLLQALRFFGRARRDANILDLPGVSLILCGLNYAAFNAALLAQPIDNNREELTRAIRAAAEVFDSRNLRWTYWVCDDFLGPDLLLEAPQIFHRHGLHPLTEAPGMYTDRLAPAQRSLPAIDVRPVADDATRAAFSELMSTAFEIPRSISSMIYGTERAWTGDLHGFVGYSEGRAVTSAASIVTGGVAGIYSVATLPQFRRLGFAEAIMRRVIEEAERTQGIRATVLQATWSGISLYERLGYRPVTNFHVYIAD